MNKISKKYQYPIMASIILPTMLLTMTAIMAFETSPDNMFFTFWLEAIKNIIPPALGVFIIVTPTVRLFVTKVLIEKEQ